MQVFYYFVDDFHHVYMSVGLISSMQIQFGWNDKYNIIYTWDVISWKRNYYHLLYHFLMMYQTLLQYLYRFILIIHQSEKKNLEFFSITYMLFKSFWCWIYCIIISITNDWIGYKINK